MYYMTLIALMFSGALNAITLTTIDLTSRPTVRGGHVLFEVIEIDSDLKENFEELFRIDKTYGVRCKNMRATDSFRDDREYVILYQNRRGTLIEVISISEHLCKLFGDK